MDMSLWAGSIGSELASVRKIVPKRAPKESSIRAGGGGGGGGDTMTMGGPVVTLLLPLSQAATPATMTSAKPIRAGTSNIDVLSIINPLAVLYGLLVKHRGLALSNKETRPKDRVH
jgi:hypothetical protein